MSDLVKDPICGKDVDPLRARAVGIFGGVTYYFCSQDCKARFKDPRKQPREPTRDIGTRPRRTTGETAAAGSEPASATKEKSGEPKEAVAHDKPWARRARDEESVKVDPSPSVEEELRASQPQSRLPWVIAVMLLAGAAVVLYYYFRK
jgi:YHS domain-containing protein